MSEEKQTGSNKERQEPVTMYAIMAKLFASVAKEVTDRFGEEGRQAVLEGVRQFGLERGRDIARRADSVGEKNSLENYLPNYDMGRSSLFTYSTELKQGQIEQKFSQCAFADQWKKDGTEEYGLLYCQTIDPAIASGYNSEMEVVHDEYLLKGDCCHFIFKLDQ